jgi:hypothetical protein
MDAFAGFGVHRDKCRVASFRKVAGASAGRFRKRIAGQLEITAGTLADNARLASTFIDWFRIV